MALSAADRGGKRKRKGKGKGGGKKKRAGTEALAPDASLSLGESGSKVWKKVTVDHDSFLQETEEDWGGFLELEVLEDAPGAEAVEPESAPTDLEAGKAGVQGGGDPGRKKEKKRKGRAENEECAATRADAAPRKSGAKVARAAPAKKVNMKKWNPFNLDVRIIESLRGLGFGQPTPIQKESLPASLPGGTDIVGAAQTGSGKIWLSRFP